MQVEFDAQRCLFRVTLAGRVDMERVIELLAEMFVHPDFLPGMPAIWIADGADLSLLTREAFQKFREYQLANAANRGSARLALVSSNDLAFALGRMFEQTAELPHLEINVFRDLKSAEEWVLSAVRKK